MQKDRHPPKPANQLLALKMIVEKTAALTGVDYFKELVKNLAEMLDVYGVWIATPDQSSLHLDALAFWLNGEFVDSYFYKIEGTPCEMVFQAPSVFHVPTRVVELFPRDPDLKPLGAVSYMGVALKDKKGRTLGHLAALDNKPMPELPDFFALFNIFANRAAAELERLQYESTLAESASKLKQLVRHAFDAILEIDESLAIIQANPAAQKLFAIPHLAGQAKLPELLSADGLHKIKRSIQFLNQPSSAENPAHWIPGHLECLGPDRAPFPSDATISKLPAHNESPRYILFIRDVRERLQAEEKIKTLRREADAWRQEAQHQHGQEPKAIVGNSPKIRSALRTAAQIAPTDSTVLIQGETGTGKELFAKAIHDQSPRRDKPLITVNCAAMPLELMESEFFGHVKGAFTGALSDREGRFVMADGSTLFLDEAGEMPLSLQAKLLRALQEGEIQAVGSSKTIRVDVRIIAATNRDLKEEVAAGRFREDLYYRLNVLPIQIPPLRERDTDIIELAEVFIARYAQKYQRAIEPLSEACQSRMRSYPWPGNVRELQNVIERAVITARAGKMNILQILTPPADAGPAVVAEGKNTVLTFEQMRQVEKENIGKALELTGGKISGQKGAAALLGIPATTLASKIKTLGIIS
jgi:transcriptional regulator with GAF, ATPase, and Fis domain